MDNIITLNIILHYIYITIDKNSYAIKHVTLQTHPSLSLGITD